MRSNTTSVCLPSDQLEYVRSLAEREDRPVSSVIRLLVKRAKERDDGALNGHHDRGDRSSTASESA
jgi:hypothetical protein